MRVCYIANIDLSVENAGKIHVLEVAEGLARRGHDVRLVVPAYGRNGVTASFDITHTAAGDTDILIENNGAASSSLDIIHLPISFGGAHVTASYNASLAAYLPWVAAAFRPHAYYLRDFIRCATPPLVARATAVPLVLEANAILSAEMGTAGVRVDRPTHRLQRFLYRTAAATIAVTPGIRDHLVARFGVAAERVTVLANGVNVRRFRPMDRGAIKRGLGLDGAPVVGFIGNFEAWKGIDALLRAAPHVLARRPDARFVLAGSGPREREYRELARALGVADSVWFPGQVPVEQSPRWINAFDVGVALIMPLPSGWSPLKLYSYMACGRPVVASREPGHEEVEDRGAGILVPYADPRAAAGAILRLLDHPDEADAMGAAGRALAVERHSWDQVVCETERILRAVAVTRG